LEHDFVGWTAVEPVVEAVADTVADIVAEAFVGTVVEAFVGIVVDTQDSEQHRRRV
jgi:hypothetical protein